MDVRSPIAFVRLGAHIAFLGGRSADDRVDGDDCVLATLGKVELELTRLGFRVSNQTFKRNLRPLLEKFHQVVQLRPDNATYLSAETAKHLRTTAQQLEEVVYSECESRLIAVSTNRRFDFEVLLKHPESLFTPGVIPKLSEIAKIDVFAACRCIAFDCPTAAAFHILRGIEECVRIVYRAYFPRRNDKRAWGPLVQELKDKGRKPRPDPILLTRLDELRDHFRNPTQHPEKIYDLDEAQDLLHFAIEFIPRCIRDNRVVERRLVLAARA